jgi:hypothetical protein
MGETAGQLGNAMKESDDVTTKYASSLVHHGAASHQCCVERNIAESHCIPQRKSTC